MTMTNVTKIIFSSLISLKKNFNLSRQPSRREILVFLLILTLFLPHQLPNPPKLDILAITKRMLPVHCSPLFNHPLVQEIPYSKNKSTDFYIFPVKGLYCSGWAAGSNSLFQPMIEIIDQTELNAIVIDIKDALGTLSYVSNVPLAQKYQPQEIKIRDISHVMSCLKEKEIFPIARIVVFKDPLIAAAKPEWSVRSKNGGIWRDNKGFAWIDPYNRHYWDYIVDLSREAIELGFEEIQYDYVRFTSDGNIRNCVYPAKNRLSHEELIPDFLEYVKNRLAPYKKPISADVFGLCTSLHDDLGIGQNYEKLAPSVDIICPMVYPSHYLPGNFGLANPDLHPYKTVYRATVDGKTRLEKIDSDTVLRPWLQDFSLGSNYGRQEIQAQIKAVNDAGITQWIFWNPRCRYQLSKYKK